jgi:hypothetical protein
VRVGIGYSKEERQRIIRCCRQVLHQESKLSFSVNALAQSRPDQRGSGDFPKTAVKIALSKAIISATVGEAGGSGSYKSREEPVYELSAVVHDLSTTITALKSWTA